MKISIQQVFPENWELFRQVRLQALQEAPWAFASRYETWAEAGEDQWRTRLREVPNNWVALQDDQPVGLIGGLLTEPGRALLRSMWVAPTARGQGVADALIGTVLDWARSQPGLKVVELEVYEHNVKAQNLYLRNGFAFRTPKTGDPRNELWMQLAV